MPLRLPTRLLRRSELDQRLAAGDRRQGMLLYRTRCPDCEACVPLRIPVERFVFTRSHRRVLRRGDGLLTTTVGPPTLSAQRVELYNRHRLGRGLGDGRSPIDAEAYQDFLVSTCCETVELRYHLGAELIGVAVADRAQRALSAVYTYFDPTYQRLGVGTYSILKQIELCQRLGLAHLYLGLYIAESVHMRYKARFLPHERRRDGAWIPFGPG